MTAAGLRSSSCPFENRRQVSNLSTVPGPTDAAFAVKTERLALTAAEEQWSGGFKEARAARDGVLEKLGAHKTATSQIIKLREEFTDFTNQIGTLEAKLKAEGNPVIARRLELDHDPLNHRPATRNPQPDAQLIAVRELASTPAQSGSRLRHGHPEREQPILFNSTPFFRYAHGTG
jgi:hypothetical protein